MKNCKGYGVFIADGSSFYIPDALHIEKLDEFSMFNSDAYACIKAEKDGIKFIYGMDGVPDQVYLDTDENRRIITEMLKEYPEYYNVHLDY